MDEFGSCIRHSDDPTFGMSFMSYVPLGIFFSIIWPLKDLEYGGLFQANKCWTSHVMNVMLISKNNRFCSLSSFRFITCQVWCLSWCAFLKTPEEFAGIKVFFFFSSIFLMILGSFVQSRPKIVVDFVNVSEFWETHAWKWLKTLSWLDICQLCFSNRPHLLFTLCA